jgi:hypothetical protein
LAEHVLGKDEVTGSIPVMGSMNELETGSGIIEEKGDSLVNQEN